MARQHQNHPGHGPLGGSPGATARSTAAGHAGAGASHDGYTAPGFAGSDWIPAILGTAVFLYGGSSSSVAPSASSACDSPG